METKHTPGPWRVGENCLCDDVIYAFNGTVAEVFQGRMAQEVKANARLIAASVEMFEALQYALRLVEISRRYFPKSIHNNDAFFLELTCAAIGKAIAKAEGRELVNEAEGKTA